MNPEWPSPGKEIGDFGGDWTSYCAHCYGEYHRDFHTSKPQWPVEGKRFNVKRHPEINGQCATFWHIITEGSDESNRLPSLDRCARICWPRQIIDEFNSVYPASSSARIVWWKTSRRGEERYILACADFSYVVVVADRGEYVLLWTAYPVEFDSRRRKLQREFQEFWGNG